jgi:hypothetical protein
MGMKILKVRLMLEEELLGTAPNDPNIHREYIASKAPNAATVEDEVAAVGIEEVVEKSMTVFPRNTDGKPILYDYQIKGFFKDACGALSRAKDTKSSKLKAYKKEIDGLIFPKPRQITIQFEGEMGNCQRPLRASTAQGERVALANSEAVPAGAIIEFDVLLLKDDLEEILREWLDYGALRGLGQWRNSGKGRFCWEER